MKSTGKMLHSQAEKAREVGHLLESLHLCDQAVCAFVADGDESGLVESIASRSITLRVYANQHESKNMLKMAKYEMLGAVAIARESGDKKALALPLYNLAQIQEDLGELVEAVETYRESITAMSSHPPEGHDNQSVLANMNIHMTVCQHNAGDKSALQRAFDALRELEESAEIDKYTRDVWLSGGYLRLAYALRHDDPSEAQQLFAKAKEIIESNSDLILRRQQIETFAKKFHKK